MKKEAARLKLNKAQSLLNLVEMDYKNSENRIAELKEDIEKLEAIINKKDNWREKLISDTGNYSIIAGRKGFTYGKGFDRDKIEHTFKEENHAKIMANKMQLMQEMHSFAYVKNEGWIADWRDGRKNKFGILYNAHDEFEVRSIEWCNYFVFGVSVKSREIAEEMFEEFGGRIEEIYNKQY